MRQYLQIYWEKIFQVFQYISRKFFSHHQNSMHHYCHRYFHYEVLSQVIPPAKCGEAPAFPECSTFLCTWKGWCQGSVVVYRASGNRWHTEELMANVVSCLCWEL